MHDPRQLMRSAKVWLGIAAALALTLVPAAAASAANPEIYPPPTVTRPYTFTISTTAGAALETYGMVGTCRSLAGSGKFTGAKGGTATLTLSECGTLPNYCHGKGLPAGIKTTELEAILVYAPKEPTVGLLLRPKPGAEFAEMESIFPGVKCGLRGSLLIGLGSPHRGGNKEFFMEELSGSRGNQHLIHYENELHEVLSASLESVEGGAWTGESWRTSPLTLKTSETMQIRY
jgi:hypothetical protein